jgi:hypothetical protein
VTSNITNLPWPTSLLQNSQHTTGQPSRGSVEASPATQPVLEVLPNFTLSLLPLTLGSLSRELTIPAQKILQMASRFQPPALRLRATHRLHFREIAGGLQGYQGQVADLRLSRR